MNAYLNTEASCAALAARYLRSAFGTLGGSSGSTEVRRLQSMAQVGVDVFQTQLQIEEHQQVRAGARGGRCRWAFAGASACAMLAPRRRAWRQVSVGICWCVRVRDAGTAPARVAAGVGGHLLVPPRARCWHRAGARGGRCRWAFAGAQ